MVTKEKVGNQHGVGGATMGGEGGRGSMKWERFGTGGVGHMEDGGGWSLQARQSPWNQGGGALPSTKSDHDQKSIF